jgi:nitroreductase
MSRRAVPARHDLPGMDPVHPATSATTSTAADIDMATIAAVIRAAGRAPSIHNTQPWRWSLHGQQLDVRGDRSRQLHVADHDGHSLLVSCGAAVELTHIALRAFGWSTTADLLPDPADPDLFARFSLLQRSRPDSDAEVRLDAALRRRSDRRVFGVQPVSAAEIERLGRSTTTDGISAHFTVRPDESLDLAVAISRADRSQRDDPAYAAEVARWIHPDGAEGDGIPTSAIPHVPAEQPRHTDIPLRDFEVGVSGGQLVTAGTDEHPLIAVILTRDDNALERLRAGQAMMRLMIQAELDGIACCPLSQSVDLLSFRTQLRSLMSWVGHPQIMLRLGQQPTGDPAPLTPRRPVDEVLTVDPARWGAQRFTDPSAPLDSLLYLPNHRPFP